jgi:hypothetical protein
MRVLHEQRRAAIVCEDEVSSLGSNQSVASDAVIERVVESPAENHVFTATAGDLIVTLTTKRPVVASASVDDVSISTAMQDVVSAMPTDAIRALVATDHVTA